MQRVTTAKLGAVALGLVTLAVAWFGYATGDDGLFQAGVYAVFASILVIAAVAAWASGDEGTGSG